MSHAKNNEQGKQVDNVGILTPKKLGIVSRTMSATHLNHPVPNSSKKVPRRVNTSIKKKKKQFSSPNHFSHLSLIH